MKAVISLSGGMDSTCLLIHLLASGYTEVHAISFNYGQKHKFELEKAKATINLLRSKGFNVLHDIVDLRSITSLLNSSLTSMEEVPEGHYAEQNMKSTVVPNRNVIFSSIIYAIAQSTANKDQSSVDITLGVHSGDHAIYPDCRPESLTAVEYAFKVSNWDPHLVNYRTPFMDLNKTEILECCLMDCQFLGLDFDEVLSNTLTSYNPDEKGRSSGKSGSDIERIEAFLNIERKDPIEYQMSWREVVEHAKSVLGRE